MLVILTIAHGLWALQAILAAVLIAVGRMRSLGVIMVVTMLLGVPTLAGMIYVAGGRGAAVGTAWPCSPAAAPPPGPPSPS